MPVDHALPQVWVEDPGYADRARHLIDAYLRASSQGPPRTCMQCGEENPPAFDLCWSCAAALPG